MENKTLNVVCRRKDINVVQNISKLSKQTIRN